MINKLTFETPGKTTYILLLIVTAIVFAGTIQAAEKTEPKITSDTKVEPLLTLTDKEERTVSLAAGKILSHAESARLAILEKKNEDAVKHIDQGLLLVNIIENAVPKRKVTTDIKSDNLTYHEEKEIAQRYISIYDESYVEDIVTPVLNAKKNKVTLKKADDVEKPKEKPGSVTPIEDFSMWNHTSMKLDVVLAKRMLEKARNALKNSKSDDADSDLQTIQTEGVTFRFVAVELPLVEAADNLKLAQIEVQDGRYAEALSTLKLASDDLKKYELLTGESRGKEVRKLYQEIDKLTSSFDDKKDLKETMKGVEKKISSWWECATNWFKK